MPGPALALVLAAAVLHAGWNVLAKRSRHHLCFLWCASVVATGAVAPVVGWFLARDGVPAAAVPFVIGTVVLHAAYFYTLGRSYRAGDFSLVYPIARGLGVALVPVGALALYRERLSPLGMLGIALVVGGIVVLHLGPREAPAAPRRAGAGGSAWALATGLTIAGYALVDKGGVMRMHPVPYIGLMFAGTLALLLPVVLAQRAGLVAEWRANRGPIVGAGLMALAAYLLVLFAFQLSKAGYVVAAREVSIVLSTLLGGLWLDEGRLGQRLAGAAVILAGVGCVALAR